MSLAVIPFQGLVGCQIMYIVRVLREYMDGLKNVRFS
jgi:hypothetical protein